MKWGPEYLSYDIKIIFLRKNPFHFSMNPNRPQSSVKGVANPRSAGTIKRLQMYRCSKVNRIKCVFVALE